MLASFDDTVSVIIMAVDGSEYFRGTVGSLDGGRSAIEWLGWSWTALVDGCAGFETVGSFLTDVCG